MGHFRLEVASMVVTWWIVACLPSDGSGIDEICLVKVLFKTEVGLLYICAPRSTRPRFELMTIYFMSLRRLL